MYEENYQYRKDMIFSNRRRIYIVALVFLPAGLLLLAANLFYPDLRYSTADLPLYSGLFIAMASLGLLAMLYPVLLGRRSIPLTLEWGIQQLITGLAIINGALLTVIDLGYGEGFAAFVAVSVLVVVILRNGGIALLIHFALAVAVLVGGALLRGVAVAPSLVLQGVLFSGAGYIIALVQERDHRERYEIQVQLIEQSIIDPLTDVYNRRFFIEELERSVQRRRRYQHGFCLAILDIDRFKTINDKYGHLVGDSILEAYAWKLLDHLRESDVVARYGGDEFLLLLAETTLERAVMVLERVRQHFEEFRFDGIAEPVTCSMGVVECGPEDSTSDLIHRADQMLYMSKEQGRNRVSS